MMGLTPRARELLAYLSERDLCPTFAEMGDALGNKSRRSITHLLCQLEERGYTRRERGQVRAIEVLKPVPPVVIRGERYRFIPVGRG